jgi:diaminopimelate decarboxylase
LVANVKHTLALARSVQESGIALETVNLGGGFGVPYHEGQTALDLDAACAGILAECKAFSQSFPDVSIILELGRYLTAEAGVYVARVEDVKISRGKTYCVLDGGMNHHLAASGNFGQVIRKAFRMGNLSHPERTPEPCRVVGPLCTSIDFLGEVALPRPEIGDRIAIFDSGAYGYSASPLGFLSHPTPLELAMDETGKVSVIRLSVIPGFEEKS